MKTELERNRQEILKNREFFGEWLSKLADILLERDDKGMGVS